MNDTGEEAGTSEPLQIAETVDEDAEIDHPKKSAVWKYFAKLDAVTAECIRCAKKLKTKYGSTSALSRHMDSVHKIKLDAASTSSDANEHTDGRTRNTKFFEKTSEKAKAITDAIAYMMVKDLQPYSIVEDEGFKHVMSVTEPRYQLPHRTTFSRIIIPDLYDSVRQKVRDEIRSDLNKGIQTLAFTTDGWTSRAVDNYMSLTVHYVTAGFINQQYMLNVRHFPASHSAHNLRIFFKELLHEWGLDDTTRNIYFVTDNARNIVKAIEEEDTWNRIPCFAHTLQLAVKDTLAKSPALVELCKRCRQIVGFFARSTKGRTALNDAQKQLNPDAPTLTLIQDVDTRWNSQHDMLKRLLKLRIPLSIVLCERSMPENLSSAEWAMLEKFVFVLGPLKEATELMSGEQYPTLSYYVPVVLGLMSAAKDNISEKETESDSDSELAEERTGNGDVEDDADTAENSEGEASDSGDEESDDVESEEEATDALATHLYEALEHRFNEIIGRDCFIIAMLIDPRFKNRLCSSGEQKQKYCELLRATLMATQTSTDGELENNVPFNNRHDNEGEPVSKLRKFLENVYMNERQEVMSYQSKIEREMDMYFHEQVAPPGTLILKWWEENGPRFPTLSIVAKNYLSIPATQVSSERLFSTTGNIATSTRATILTEHVEELCFLQRNLKLSE